MWQTGTKDVSNCQQIHVYIHNQSQNILIYVHKTLYHPSYYIPLTDEGKINVMYIIDVWIYSL